MGAAFTGFMALCGVAWVYERTRKKIQHPELGQLTFEWDTWSGLLPHYRQEEPAVRFELPGSKQQPEPGSPEKLLDFWSSISQTISTIRPHAIEEFMEIASAYEGEPEEEIVDQVSQSQGEDFDQHWSLVGIVLEDNESEATWTLEFEVEWDPEHTRSAYLDNHGNLLGYGLSCAGLSIEPSEP